MNKKVADLKVEMRQRFADFRPGQSLYNKIERGPLASILTKGPLAKYKPKPKADAGPKAELQEVNPNIFI
jgi:hypothetical protein